MLVEGQAHLHHSKPWTQEGIQSHLAPYVPLALSEPGAWLETRFTSRLAQPPMTWHLSWPLAQLSKAQRMDLFSLPFSKDQGGEALGQVGLFP